MYLINVVFAVVTVFAIVIMIFGLHEIDTRLARIEHTMADVGEHVSQLPTVKTEAVHVAQPRQLKWR